MDLLRAMIHGVMSAILAPFAGRDPFAGVCALGVALGVAALCMFRMTSNPQKIRAAKKQLMAHLYELRLFPDEPALVWRAQVGLLASNARYIGLMLVPALLIAIPMTLAFGPLDSFFGRTPILTGEAALVTVQMNSPAQLDWLKLSAPEGIAIESPGVRAIDQAQVSWRIRAEKPVDGMLRISSPDGTIQKSVRAGAGPRLISERRVSSALDLLEYSNEPRIRSSSVDWIEIQYPRSRIHAAGMDLPWWVWMLAVSMATALLLRRAFRVTF